MNLRNIIDNCIIKYPYEGDEIDKYLLEQKIKEILKGLISYSHKFTKTDKGYKDSLGIYYSREEIVEKFLNS